MPSITLANLRTRAKQRANMENSNFVKDAEWNSYINYSISQLRDKMISKVGNDYFASQVNIPLINGTSAYALPNDFYKILYVEMLGNDGNYYKMRRFEIAEQNIGRTPISSFLPEIRYRLTANNIVFTLDNTFGGRQVRLTYVPVITELAIDADTLNGYNGWEEFVILLAARKALVKEEQDLSQLDVEIALMDQRLEAMADNRDQSNPMRVYDNQRYYDSGFNHGV